MQRTGGQRGGAREGVVAGVEEEDGEGVCGACACAFGEVRLFFVFSSYSCMLKTGSRGDLQVALELYRRAETYVPDNVKLKER